MLIGRGDHCQITLRDPTLPKEVATLWANELEPRSPFWIRFHPHSPYGRLGDFSVREAHWPPGIPLQMGESRLTLEQTTDLLPSPSFPSGVRPWMTISESGRQTLWMAKKAATTPLSIYIAGETGTGKEVMAQLIHAWSDRKSGPFIPLHCGALPLSLAESELFGHVKGAFTGAVSHRPGALMQAHGGTLFLDEIGDLPLDIQVKLLRFLENGEIRPVGADRSSRADVRIVCATHHPLQKLIQEKKFRQDLYYRLASVTLQIPTLRSRPDDVELLARKFTQELKHHLSPRALLRLQAHTWPGNVRELRHAIERACGLAGSFNPTLTEEAFEFLISEDDSPSFLEGEFGASVLSLRELERVALLKALKLAKGNRARAAKILGIARSTLFEMLKRHKVMGPKQLI
jgi:transcriptional regulator with PAS, ATPase and Fis domain